MSYSISPSVQSIARRISLTAVVVALSAFGSSALAQAPSQDLSSAPQESSSLSYKAFLADDLTGGSLSPSPQYGESGRGGRPAPAYRDRFSHVALEVGGGFTAPLANTQRELTYGWNFRGGVGYKASRDLSLMAEYEFDRNKINGATLSAVGEPGGNTHIWSLTLDPVLYYKTSGSWGGYITGGGGFYRRLTSFTQPAIAYGQYCDYFYCYPYQYTTNVTVSHYSSNQAGANLGTGFTFGGWNSSKFYMEARYEWLNTPGRGTELIPVTVGLRW